MMHAFLSNNRDELIFGCKRKVSRRLRRDATSERLENGVPLFLDRLICTLVAMDVEDGGAALRPSGKALLALRFTVDQVAQNYSGLCQAITELAHERGEPIHVEEFKTLIAALGSVSRLRGRTSNPWRDLAGQERSRGRMCLHHRLPELHSRAGKPLRGSGLELWGEIPA